MSLSSSSSHATVTYTSESSDDDLPSWGIPLMETYESNLKAPLSPVPALEYLDLEEDLEMDPINYAADKEEEEEEGHLALADSTLSVPDSVPSAKEKEPFETDEARISVRPHSPPSPSTEARIAEYVVAPTPPSLPPAPLSPLSSPFLLISSPPLPLPSPDCRGLITAIEMVNERMTDFAATLRHDSEEFYTQAHYACQAWGHSEDRSQAMEAQIKALQDEVKALQTKTRVLQRQRIDDGDRLTRHIQHEYKVLARAPEQPVTPMFEKIELCSISAAALIENQVQYATYTLLGNALTWWNSQVKTIGYDAAYGMTWKTLMKMLTDKYCPRSEIKNLEIEIWNLKVKGTDVVEKYVGGLLDMIQSNVMSARPKTMQEAIELANDLMDQKKEYVKTIPLCTKCNYNHNGVSAPMCNNYKRVGLLARDCRNPAAANNQIAPREIQEVVTCYECGVQGHYKKDCPKLKNKNRRNQAGNSEARGKAYILGGDEPNTNSNVVTELRSFDVIIGMDWLSKYHAVIVCDEKIVHVPFRIETLIICGDRSNHGSDSRLNIISCTNTQKYLLKGCHVFLAQITVKKARDKLEEKRLKDVPVVRYFLEVFPEDLPSVPSTRQVEF
ncbi:putative reverse transcriptase domain-containing protein [Tanacetum coccineum]